MKKLVVLIVLVIAVTGVIIMANQPKQTKIPYDNGFYSGQYNPNLPKISPK